MNIMMCQINTEKTPHPPREYIIGSIGYVVFVLSISGGGRARICKCLWSPGIESEESMPLAYVAWRGPVQHIGLSYRSAGLGIDFWAP
jgi:hypothetical protein